MRISDWSSDVCSSDLAGEIFLNSVDHDGARKGYDLDSLRAVATAVDLPVIAFGGVFTWPHLLAGIEAGAEAVAAANIFHYTEQANRQTKTFLPSAGVPGRSQDTSPAQPKEDTKRVLEGKREAG